jgi:small subunit ribosomal protein S8
MMTDPIADMLTRIRNAVRIERATVEVPSSKVKQGLADVLKREGYIWDWELLDLGEQSPVKSLRLDLKYGPNGERVIRHIKRISKPGRRVYSRARELKPILQGTGISVVSTSRGVISDREARQRNLGGEVLCEIW